MIKKFLSFTFLLSLLFILYLSPFFLTPALAQTPCATSSPNPRVTGLVSSPLFSPLPGNTNKFYTSPTGSGCAIDSKTAFAPYTIPTYDRLKSLYFDQSKATKDSTTLTPGFIITSSFTSFSGDKVWYDSGDLTVSGTPTTGTGTQVIFVNGNLSITGNYTYGGTSTTGTVFVVKGNVYISSSVTQVNAVIFSAGNIYTAATAPSTCATSAVTGSLQLTINGSLIALTDTAPTASIQFCRSQSDNTTPAEKIVYQVKYLVILRTLMSDTFQKWSEIQ